MATEVLPPPEFGNYVIEQNDAEEAIKLDNPPVLQHPTSSPASQFPSVGMSKIDSILQSAGSEDRTVPTSNNSPPSLTKLNSILGVPTPAGNSSITSGVSFSSNKESGVLSPRSMKLDQILGARSDSNILRGISVRVGNGSGQFSPQQPREGATRSGYIPPSNSFQRPTGLSSFTGMVAGTPHAPSPSFRNPDNSVALLNQMKGVSMRQTSFSTNESTRSPRANNRVQAVVTFSEELLEKFSRLDVADRCRVGQRLRADVISHFSDIYTIPAEDILISFELTDAMQLQTTFELPPSAVDSRTRNIILFRAKTPVRPDSMMEELRKL